MNVYAQRALTWEGNVRRDVEVSASKHANACPTTVCLSHFKKVFGFTPRKNKSYVLSFGDVEVAEQEERLDW